MFVIQFTATRISHQSGRLSVRQQTLQLGFQQWRGVLFTCIYIKKMFLQIWGLFLQPASEIFSFFCTFIFLLFLGKTSCKQLIIFYEKLSLQIRSIESMFNIGNLFPFFLGMTRTQVVDIHLQVLSKKCTVHENLATSGFRVEPTCSICCVVYIRVVKLLQVFVLCFIYLFSVKKNIGITVCVQYQLLYTDYKTYIMYIYHTILSAFPMTCVVIFFGECILFFFYLKLALVFGKSLKCFHCLLLVVSTTLMNHR